MSLQSTGNTMHDGDGTRTITAKTRWNPLELMDWVAGLEAHKKVIDVQGTKFAIEYKNKDKTRYWYEPVGLGIHTPCGYSDVRRLKENLAELMED